MRAGRVQRRLPSRVGLTSAIVAALLTASAAAQDNSTQPPASIDRFSLPPGPARPTPTPTPTPAPTPAAPAATLTPAAPPSVVPTLQIPRTTPTPVPTVALEPTRAAPAPRPAATPAPAPSGAQTETPPAVAPSTERQAVQPSVAPTPLPSPAVDATPAVPAAVGVSAGPPAWLWWLVGAVVLAGAAFLIRRRFVAARANDDVEVSEPEAVSSPLTPAPTPGPPARTAAAVPSATLALDLRPGQLVTRGPDAHLALELIVTNTAAAAVEAVRPVIALVSAGPDTAAEVAGFAADAGTLPGGEPFTLRAGETRTIAAELTLPGDAMYVTSAADRELIVPLVLVSLTWRAGLSVARVNEAFVVGTGDAGSPRLGPIWVDRAGLVYAKLDARRFTPGAR